MQGHAAQDVGVDLAESPAADQQIDHAAGGGAGRVGQVGSRLHHHPGVGGRVGRGAIAGLDQRAGQRLLLVQLEAQRYVERALDAVDADLAIALRRVAVAATEQRAAD